MLYYTGGRFPLRKDSAPVISTRCGKEWLVKEEDGYSTCLKATAQVESNKPPISGWQFNNLETEQFEEDETLTCRPASTSPPCCLTVSLSGFAKKVRGKCEGEYKSTGLTSLGRQVLLVQNRFLHSFISFFGRSSSWRGLTTAISM